MKSIAVVIIAVMLVGCNSTPEVAENKSPEQAVLPAESPKPVAPPAPTQRTYKVPQGTRLRVQTSNTISTKSAQSGEPFSGSLAEAILVDGKVVVPKGADVQGIIVDADEGGRVKGVASLSLRLTHVALGGKRVPIESALFMKDAPATKKKDAVKVGIGAGIGAAIGAIADGGKGAAIGAASGAGAGTGVVLATRGDPAVVAAESIISFSLAAPLNVTLRN